MQRFNRMVCAVIVFTPLLTALPGCETAAGSQSVNLAPYSSFLYIPGANNENIKTNFSFNRHFDFTSGFNIGKEILFGNVEKSLNLIETKGITEQLTGKANDYAAQFPQARRPWLHGTIILTLFAALLVIFLLVIKRYERKRLAISINTHIAELEKAEKMTRMLNQMSVLFLSQDNRTYEEKLSSGVELVADVMNLDRVSVWRNIDSPDGLLTSQIYRWDRNSGGSTPPIPELARIPLALIYRNWKKVLQSEEIINGPIKLMNPVPAFFKQFSVVSVFVTPLAINNDEGWGFVLFEDRKNERIFDDNSAEALRSAAFLFVNTIILKEKNQEISNIVSKLNAVVSNYSGVVWSVDREETITLFNGLYLEDIGITPDFIEGKKLDAARRKGRHLDIIDHVRKTIDEGHPQNWISNFDGKKFHARSVPVFDERGQVSSVVGSINDLTQIIELQEKLEAALEEAEKASQIAVEASRAKSDFLSHMSHEIRTPLNAVIGMISIGLNTDDVAKKNYCFDRADSASKHLLGIINDILDMSKIEANKFELSYGKIDFKKMLMNITDATTIQAEEKKQNFVINLNSNVPEYIEGDELRLSQVIINLLSNAIKFTPEKGTVKLNIEKMDAIVDGDEVFLWVEVVDTGIGISKEQQERLFTSFNQADSSITKEYGGTGLGLAISKKIIELMGGSIWIESELGKGAKFIFTAKVKKLELKPSAKLSANIDDELPIKSKITRRRYDFKNHTLLIAEDVEINREIISTILEETGISIDYAENGRIAVSMFRENPEKYSLILMDVNMPEMDGYEATRQIRALDLIQAKDIPIIAMTANVFKEDVEKCLESGMNDHTGKPIDTSAILGMLKKYINNPEETRKMKNMHDLRQGIAWNENLLTGNAIVDMQHQKIFERVSDLVQSCEDGSDIVKLQDTLAFLVNHTVRHFADEEALMLEYGYPNYGNHKGIHDEFKESVNGLVQRFKDSGSSAELSGDVNKTVARWLINHIQNEDKKISDYIRAIAAAGEG